MKFSFIKNLATIFFLGISSGLPLSLILSTLKAFLVDGGIDLKTIGFFSLISLPYTFKFLFAPIMDSCRVPLLSNLIGQRKSWIVLTQILLISFIASLGIIDINNINISLAVTLSVLIAFASASQDIVIDAYRIELIKKEDQGLAAGFYIYGYRIGMLISGAAALAMSQFFAWEKVFIAMAGCMSIAAVITLFIEESRKNWQPKYDNLPSWFKISVIEPFKDFSNHNNWFLILLFIAFFKLADAFAGNLTLPFLLDIEFTKVEIASIVKTFGLFATLFGVFCGGIIVKKLGIVKSLWIAAVAQIVSNLVFSYLANVGHNTELLYAVIFIENFSGGIGDAVFVTYLSSLCSIEFSATQYSLLISLATFARSMLSSSAGIVAEKLGWYYFFIFSAVIALPGLVFLYFVENKQKTKKS